VRVWVESAAADGIKAQILDAFLSLPKRGAEAGGLLLGEVERAQPLTVRITGFAPVPCEYRFGPSYSLSETDREKMAKELEANGAAVVGLYRSYTGREAALDNPDRELIAAFFSRRPQVFLLIRPLTAERCEAAFAYGDGRALHGPAALSAFPFAPAEAAPAPQEASIADLVPEPALVRADEQAPDGIRETGAAPAPVRPPLPPPRLRRYAEDEPRSSRRPRFWIPLIALIALSIGAAFLYEWWTMGGRTVTAPQEVAGVESADRLAMTPANSSAASAQHDAAPPASPEPSPAAMPAQESSASPETPPPAPAQPARSSRRAPAPRLARSQEIAVAPVAVHTVQPGVSQGIRSRIAGRVIVPVEVKISESGRVTSAIPEKGSGAVYDYLSTLAAGAARNWRFQPARSHSGAPVPATKTLYFVFTNRD
jgi:hypothetical protein